jgi:hypothetical protein
MQFWYGKSLAKLGFVAIAAFALGLAAPSTQIAAQEDVNTITIALNEYQGSGVSGWATLTAADEGITVAMAVEGAQITGDHPTHIHTGTCENFDPSPTFPLTTIVLDPLSADGVSESSVPDVTLDELLGSDYVILVHKSMDELTNYFVCGEINQANAIVPAAGAAGSVGMADTGTGSALDGRSTTDWLTYGLALTALLLAGVAFQLRRRSTNS